MPTSLTLSAAAVMVVAILPPAFATPFINVTATWGEVVESLPAGLSVSCSGNAVVVSGLDCDDRISVNHPLTHPESASLTHSGGLWITNNGPTEYSGTLTVGVGFSSFNPGGPEVGVSIDRDDQLLSFSSSSGLDNMSCSLPNAGQGTGREVYFSEFQCGLSAPDASSFVTDIDVSLAPGQRQEMLVEGGEDNLSLSYSFSAVPEPGMLGLFAVAAMVLGAITLKIS